LRKFGARNRTAVAVALIGNGQQPDDHLGGPRNSLHRCSRGVRPAPRRRGIFQCAFRNGSTTR
jgi:hypothetical protein